MVKDKRKKGCPNENCERHQNNTKLDASEEFCPKCGSRLVFVCKECFREIEDTDLNHVKCKLCEAKGLDLRKQVVEVVGAGAAIMALNAPNAKKIINVAKPVMNGIAKELVKDGQKKAAKVGVKVVKSNLTKFLK